MRVRGFPAPLYPKYRLKNTNLLHQIKHTPRNIYHQSLVLQNIFSAPAASIYLNLGSKDSNNKRYNGSLEINAVFVLVIATGTFTNSLLLSRQQASLKSNHTATQGLLQWKTSALFGTEFPSRCKSMVNERLGKTNDYDKWGSSITTTILTLLPTLLTFGPVPTAKFSNLMALSPMVVLVTARMTLGLPVRSIEPFHRVITVRNFTPDGGVASYGVVDGDGSGSSGGKVMRGLHHRRIRGLSELHGWYTGNPTLIALQRRVFRPKRSSTIGKTSLWIIFFGGALLPILLDC
ncbi:hypothetical protein BDD12DRAFT_981361 [Trichophaea hybrida]|nr:hypothetical protein BDD12DRAFT_981361 [Trichophaea hybrida]